MPQRKIFFFHNPKAGGTSISEWLSVSYSAKERAPLIVNDRDRHRELGGRYEQYRGYKFYAGHYGRDIFNAVNDGHVAITNFRDPVDRLISLYNYFRFVISDTDEILKNTRFACVQAAKRQDVGSFLLNDDPAVTLYTRDYHVRQLTHSGFEATADLDSALQIVAGMPWYFVSEESEASITWAENWLQTPLPSLPHSNVTPLHENRISRLDRELSIAVRQRNQLDYALYDFARKNMPNYG